MRKEEQAYNRGRPWVDPYNDNYGARHFREGREVHRYAQCQRTDRNCYFTADYETYRRIKRAERDADRVYDDARYYSDRAYNRGRYADRAFDDRDYRLDNGRRRGVGRAYDLTYELNTDDCEDWCDQKFEFNDEFNECLDFCNN
jgi:hypothetical protein